MINPKVNDIICFNDEFVRVNRLPRRFFIIHEIKDNGSIHMYDLCNIRINKDYDFLQSYKHYDILE